MCMRPLRGKRFQHSMLSIKLRVLLWSQHIDRLDETNLWKIAEQFLWRILQRPYIHYILLYLTGLYAEFSQRSCLPWECKKSIESHFTSIAYTSTFAIHRILYVYLPRICLGNSKIDRQISNFLAIFRLTRN